MCGIAGYHLAPEIAATMIDEPAAYNAIVTGLKENKHRGGHASGFFAVVGNHTMVSKLNVNADAFVNDVLPKVPLGGVPTIVGVHTRAATKGEPENNINNHPVIWGDVIVTHNGMIYNDDVIKKAVTFKQDPMPEVDTAAIAAALNHAAIDPELEFEGVVKALSSLQGSFAIHAVWETAPGYSLLARGTGSPLHVSYDDMGVFLYSSETVGLKELQKTFGVRFDIRQFDPRTVLLLRNGIPVRWATMPDPGESDVLVMRMTPGGEPWVESTRKQYYAAQGRPWNIADDEKARLLLERGKVQPEATLDDMKNFANVTTFVGRKLPDPIPSTAPLATLAEADQVFRFSRDSGQDDTVSAWFGSVELLLDNDGKLIDVFNWDLGKFDRFDTIDLEPENETAKTFEEFWREQTSMVSTYGVLQRPFQKAVGTTTTSLPFTGGVRGTRYRDETRPDGLPAALFKNQPFMGIQEVNRMQRCKRDDSIPLLLNERCQIHGQWSVNHIEPAACKFIQMSTLAALDKAPTITTMMAMVRGRMELRTYSPSNTDGCVVHAWWAADKLDIPIEDGQLIRVQIPFRDKCRDCDFVREVKVWTPAVARYLNERVTRHVTV